MKNVGALENIFETMFKVCALNLINENHVFRLIDGVVVKSCSPDSLILLSHFVSLSYCGVVLKVKS